MKMRFFFVAMLAMMSAVPATLAQQLPSSKVRRLEVPGTIKVEKRNPTENGWGISFNLENQTSPPYNNGAVTNVRVDRYSTAPTNGSLVNLVVEPGYCWAIVGLSPGCAAPVAVGQNVNMQVQGGSGNDYWGLLGVLDFQQAGAAAGGQATSGIIRGQWTGTNLSAGLNSVAENYSGRSLTGVMVNASMTDGLGQPFDNAYSIGSFIHKAKDAGYQVGGKFGGADSVIPTKPFVFYNASQSGELWSITNNAASATENIVGASVITSPSGGFPLLQMTNSNAGADLKQWHILSEADGSWNLRALNDAQNSATSAIRITRAGSTPATTTVNTPTIIQGYVKTTVFTVATLPTCNAGMEGARAAVSDASSSTFYATLGAGGGASRVPVYCNSTNWVVGG